MTYDVTALATTASTVHLLHVENLQNLSVLIAGGGIKCYLLRPGDFVEFSQWAVMKWRDYYQNLVFFFIRHIADSVDKAVNSPIIYGSPLV